MHKPGHVNYSLASDDFCQLLVNLANSLDPDLDQEPFDTLKSS